MYVYNEALQLCGAFMGVKNKILNDYPDFYFTEYKKYYCKIILLISIFGEYNLVAKHYHLLFGSILIQYSFWNYKLHYIYKSKISFSY